MSQFLIALLKCDIILFLLLKNKNHFRKRSEVAFVYVFCSMTYTSADWMTSKVVCINSEVLSGR